MQCDTTFLFLFGLVAEQFTNARAVYNVTYNQTNIAGQLVFYSDVRQFRFICSSLTITEGRDHGLTNPQLAFIGRQGVRMLDYLVAEHRTADP